MNSDGILPTRAEVEQKEDYAYFYPDHEKIADSKLDFRAMGPKSSLYCYFSYLKIIPDYCCMRGVDELE